MVKLNFKKHQASPFYETNGKRLYEIWYEVDDWKNINYKTQPAALGELIKALQRDVKKILKGNQTKFQFSLNCQMWTIKREVINKKIITRIAPIGWRSGGFESFDNMKPTTILFDSVIVYIKKVIVMIRQNVVNEEKGKAGKDIHNDCVFNAIFKAHNFNVDSMPSKINKAYKFKKYFGYERDDKVDILKIVAPLQEILKSTIEIIGDVSFCPEKKKPKNIKLKLKQEHVTLLSNDGKKNTTNINYVPVKKENVYTFKFESSSEIRLHTGVLTKEITFEEYTKLYSDFDYLMIKCEKESDLTVRRNQYIAKADYYNKTTIGILNFYKSQYTSKLAYDIWRQKTKNLKEPDELLDIEHFALDQANSGGVHYAKSGKHTNCIDYDMNMMYLYLMSQNNFTFPTTQPQITKITTDELTNKPFLSYGLYLCKINISSIWIPKCDKFKWYPQFILNIARSEQKKYKLEIKNAITMFEDENGSTNALIYDQDRLTGKIAFKDYTDFVIDLRKKTDVEFKAESKELSSCLWGYFTSKNKKIIRVSANDKFYYQNYNIEELIPLDKGDYNVVYSKKRKIFKYNYARIGAFLTSYCRYKLYQICQTHKLEPILLNTDGMILQNQSLPDELIGNEAGKFKIVHDIGTVQISSSNSYMFE